MIEEAASILAHHQTEKQAEESGNFLFSSSLSSAGLRQRRPMNHLSTATAMEGSSVSAPGGGGTSRAKKPLHLLVLRILLVILLIVLISAALLTEQRIRR